MKIPPYWWWVSGKHSTKGMMEMMLFAAVLKLRWVSLGKSVKSTCKPPNPGWSKYITTGTFDYLALSLLCRWGDIFVLLNFQNGVKIHIIIHQMKISILAYSEKTVIRSHFDTAVKVVSKSGACIKFWTSGGRFRTWLDHGIDLRPPLHCTSHRLALMWGSAKFHLHFILHLHLHWQRIWLAPE